ncbi:hypothetical protein CCHR01_05688 [Colletotrichum chrysophilum]|uniref:Uncharacterized protein n=1 Tax=Colletotrichum chrysophilum TaxID=1836956 RepID=A0AAD9AQL7_9PEZI|nr:hypothetical protein CCHR01_05688 [Colletotrichum chrysophilum]
MPSSTVQGAILVNAGDVTTTWTAPPSCATKPVTVQLGNGVDVGRGGWQENCTLEDPGPYDECVPDVGIALLNLLLNATNISTRSLVFYHSPGLVCPSAWTPAGTAIRYDATSYDLSGVFADPTLTITKTASSIETQTLSQITPYMNPVPNMVMSALEPGETGIWCCLCGYTAQPFGPGCYSEVPRSLYTANTACSVILRPTAATKVNVTYTYHGRTITAEDFSWTAWTETTYPTTVSWTGSTAYPDALITTQPVILVHKAQDAVETGAPQCPVVTNSTLILARPTSSAESSSTSSVKGTSTPTTSWPSATGTTATGTSKANGIPRVACGAMVAWWIAVCMINTL